MKPKAIKNKVIIATGGTGGHVFPAVAVANELISRGIKPVFLSDKRGEKYISKDLNLDIIVLPVRNFNSNNIIKNIKNFYFLFLSFIKSCFIILTLRPTLVVGFGGFASLPSVVVACLLRTPTVIHEQNTVLGRTNRFLSKYCKLILLSFEQTLNIPTKLKTPSYIVGNPVRISFIRKEKYFPPKENEKVNILILGGSQGAKVFSDLIPKILCKLPIDIKNRIEVVHQCRDLDIKKVEKSYVDNLISHQTKGFINNMEEVLKESHLVISRAGASSLSEILVANIPSILIPFRYSKDNHQLLNANRLVNTGASWMIEEDNYINENLFNLLKKIFSSMNTLSEKSERASRVARPYSAEEFVNLLDRYFFNSKPNEISS